MGYWDFVLISLLFVDDEHECRRNKIHSRYRKEFLYNDILIWVSAIILLELIPVPLRSSPPVTRINVYHRRKRQIARHCGRPALLCLSPITVIAPGRRANVAAATLSKRRSSS